MLPVNLRTCRCHKEIGKYHCFGPSCCDLEGNIYFDENNKIDESLYFYILKCLEKEKEINLINK